jgi:predicted TIM-barrel fold metal-dependent hydrolase
VAKAHELGVPVMIATGYPWVSHALQVADLSNSVPEANIIMTHGGQINISGLAQADAFLAMSQCDNLYMETSGLYRQDFIEESIARFGAHRVLFGSNSPNMHQGFERDRALSATKISEEIREAVLGGSVMKLLMQGGISG